MESIRSGKKVIKKMQKMRGNLWTSDSALAVMLEKHKLEPTGIGIIGNPQYHEENPFVCKMEDKYRHLFGKV
ncbi:MAG: hypothetical protein NTY68_05515 [Candidatus Micrarchaeota archaeon]|nr:hypothetical protein [Candidatus Micrarchaeota archaeon]